MFFNIPKTLFRLFFFFFNDTATTEIYTLSLHDALPISRTSLVDRQHCVADMAHQAMGSRRDRKSTRLNSSHPSISYAVFCLKKQKKACAWGWSVSRRRCCEGWGASGVAR